jgi:hypothetical protein
LASSRSGGAAARKAIDKAGGREIDAFDRFVKAASRRMTDEDRRTSVLEHWRVLRHELLEAASRAAFEALR